MKAIYLQMAGGLALTFGLAACVSGSGAYVSAPVAEPVAVEAPAPAPAPTPTPAPTPAPSPTPTPAPLPVIDEPQYDNYLDAPQTEGTWFYVEEPGETLAVFGTGPGQSPFLMRCKEGTISLGRVTETPAERPRAMSVHTETAVRQLTVRPIGLNNVVAVDLSARDPLLDAMAITKGRFAVEVEGERTLYLPAWAEVSRVIEDCR